ncbi:phosphotransferase family protein [Aestuariimicrobium ganziense]|uniref:phosphotransferase family protein n=1 Tax=Aestuariimicrobium ganziense TaxID=2773677 RepID=UPI0019455362|nr:phosphotransferase [Aestuariimicrobium ganziense]
MTVLATFTPAGSGEAAILARFGIGPDALLGAGGESRVFALDDQRVVRIFGGRPNLDVVGHLESLAGVDIGVALPEVLEHGELAGQHYTVDRRMRGVSLASWLAEGQSDEVRQQVLLDYLDVAARLRQLPIGDGGFRSLFIADRVPPGVTLVELLRVQAEVGLQWNGLLRAAMPDLDQRFDDLLAALSSRDVEPAFVHADYFAGNVMVDDGRVSGVLDISVHALAADPVMDEVAAVCFLEHVHYPQAGADTVWLEEQLLARLGDEAWLVDAYRRWYALYYSMDEALLDWSVRVLSSSG